MNDRIAPRNFLSLLGWLLTGVAGALAIAILAISRGEPVNALWMVVASVCVFAIAYRFHSAWLMAKVLTLDELRATPARVHDDGKDYVPSNRWIVFGHHFAAIAGPGPLVGPVLAAQFGYLPGMLWILVGATLGGAVHDCVILFCSTRRRGKSLGQMVREEVGPFAGFITLVSVVAIMIILLAVLALVVVKALAESPWGLFTILASMPIAMAMGLALRRGRVPIGLVTALGVGALLLSVFAGQFLKGSPLEPVLTLDGKSLALGDHDLRTPGFCFACLASPGAARLPEHFHENWNGRLARPGDRPDCPAAANAGTDQVHRWNGPGLRRAGLSLLLHHNSVCRGFRLPRAHCVGHHAEIAG